MPYQEIGFGEVSITPEVAGSTPVAPVLHTPRLLGDHEVVSRALPSGTVTFLFTDVEGSTKLLHELGVEAYAEALTEHRRVLREAFAAHGGVEVDTQGDAFFVAFATAPGALAAARAAQEALAIPVRMGVHTGTPLVTEEGYVGADVHRAARIAAVGHGGQVLVSAATRALAEGELVDLREHRLKDLSAPERIYQLGEREFPPLRSLYRTNLPVPSTPFLGRGRELGEVLDLLGRSRLLTLTGPGGTGKTRLGLQAAGTAADAYPDGVFWVPLAPLRDPELVLEAAAHALGTENGLTDHIGDKALLVLFDNFEHMVEAAGGLAGLLAACPNLRLLVTSREPLHVSGEQEYAVPPFAHEDGVGFFVARARTVDPVFETDGAVSEICRRLDDLPLALELAAARVKALSPAQILARLEQRLPLLTGGARDLPERQRTLRATIEWSHDLLDEDERRLFARLAVFRGGCTLDAAEAVADADVDVLQSLVDKSLLRHTAERFWMLETIREYATEQLDASGEDDDLRRRHSDYFSKLGDEAWPRVREASVEWLDRLESEHDNLRAAVDWLETAGEAQRLLSLTGAIQPFWTFRGRMTEGHDRVVRALAADAAPTAARARALAAASKLANALGDREAARRWAEEALDVYRELGDPWGTANALYARAMTWVYVDWDRVRRLLAEPLELFSQLGDVWQSLSVRRRFAWAHVMLGELERAQELHEQNLELARATGYRNAEADALGILGSYATRDGRLDDAVALLKRAVELHQEEKNRSEVIFDIGRFSHVLAARGNRAVAVQLLSCVKIAEEEVGLSEQWFTEMNEALLARARTELEADVFANAWEQGRRLKVEEAVALALAETAYV